MTSTAKIAVLVVRDSADHRAPPLWEGTVINEAGLLLVETDPNQGVQ
jgi:hypothetical protein